MKEITNEWLANINNVFDANGVPYNQKVWLAKWEWSKQTGIPIGSDSENEKIIERWFSDIVPSKKQLIGPPFIGLYFVDKEFYPIIVPIVFGKVKLHIENSFKSMPYSIFRALINRASQRSEMLAIWIDCIDYGLGIISLMKLANSNNFIKSADHELISVVSLLLERRPNPIALQSSRMSIEMFLKGFIKEKAGLSDSEAKNLGHNLIRCLESCLEIDPKTELKNIYSQLCKFPEISCRYGGNQYPKHVLWSVYKTAQFTGATIVRAFTNRDSRKLIQSN